MSADESLSNAENLLARLESARARLEGAPGPDPGIEIVVRPLDAMVASARAGRIRDAKTTLALLLADGRPSLP